MANLVLYLQRQGSSVSVSTHSQPHPDPNVASIPLATSSSRGRYASDGSLSRHEDAALSSQRSEGFEIPAPPPSQVTEYDDDDNNGYLEHLTRTGPKRLHVL